MIHLKKGFEHFRNRNFKVCFNFAYDLNATLIISSLQSICPDLCFVGKFSLNNIHNKVFCFQMMIF